MRIVNVGTFLLPTRFSMVGMLKGHDRERLARIVRDQMVGFQSETANPFSDERLFFDLGGAGYQYGDSMIFVGSTDVDGVGSTGFFLSSLGVGFVVVEIDLPDDLVLDLEDEVQCERFKSFETPVTDRIEPLVEEWCARIAAAIDPDLRRPLPESALKSGQLLWWHRICVDAPAEVEFIAPRAFGVRAELGDGAYAEIGTGVSNLHTQGRQYLVADVAEGLMMATQEWIVVDEAKRHIANHLVELSETSVQSLITVDNQYIEVLRLTEDVTLRNLVLGQEARYLTAPRQRISEAASEAWKTGPEAELLEERTAALRDLFSLHRERISNDRDDRRNRLIFVFTVITLVQSFLVWYDFITSDSTTLGGAPRPTIAFTVMLLTFVTVAGAFLTRPRRQKVHPHYHARIPTQRRPSTSESKPAPTEG